MIVSSREILSELMASFYNSDDMEIIETRTERNLRRGFRIDALQFARPLAPIDFQ